MEAKENLHMIANGELGSFVKQNVNRSIQGIMIGAFAGIVLSKLLGFPWYLGVTAGSSIGFLTMKKMEV